ncbi:MAG: arylsulfatase, partial [Planctomycetota bacterium]
GLHIDGRSFLPLLTGESEQWPTRQVVFQSHRGNVPQLFNHFAIHEWPWKLVHPSGFGNEKFTGDPQLELYDLSKDPFQRSDLSTERPDIVERLREAYEDWFSDVSSTRPDNFSPPRIVIGTDQEPETVLTRQDWRHGSGKPWAPDSNGFWLLQAEVSGAYEVELIRSSDDLADGIATVEVGDSETALELAGGSRRGHQLVVQIPKGRVKLAVQIRAGGKGRGPHQVILKKRD